MLYTLGKFTVYCFLKLFFEVKIEGREFFPAKGPFILAANHVSYFDPPLLATVVKRRIWFLAKEELFRGWISRVFFRSLGAIPLKRNSNDFRAMRRALAILKQRPLLVFPQGLVGAPWEQVHAGVGFLFKRSKVPLIAARIYGAENVFPLSKSLFKREKIRIVFERMDGILPEGTNEEIAAKVMDKIKSL
jgi:1-acyl-sn-glycerol-3-phosphate acyltransferase